MLAIPAVTLNPTHRHPFALRRPRPRPAFLVASLKLPYSRERPSNPSPRSPSPSPSPLAGDFYQPFRPPQSSPIPEKYRNLDLVERLAVLRDRLGIWYEYAPLIDGLFRDGFTPPSIEDATGITGVEQNCLIVAAQVRESLAADPAIFPPELLEFYNSASAPWLLYELRLLNSEQRAAAAQVIIELQFDRASAQDLAMAMKDFPQLLGDEGWKCFDGDSPRDCLAYKRFRYSRETHSEKERIASLERALELVETEPARERIAKEMENDRAKEEEKTREEAQVAALVVRLRYGEVAEATSVLLIPVIKASDGLAAMAAAPARCKLEGEMGVVMADTPWARWVVLPKWAPIAPVSEGAVAVEVADGRSLPWAMAASMEESVLVVADRGRREVTEKGVYVLERGQKLVVERGKRLIEAAGGNAADVAVAAEVVIVVRPPKDEIDDQISDEEWD